MKRIYLVILLLIPSLAFCQNTNTQKAKLKCKTYLLKHLNDPGSYKPASWSSLQTINSEFDESKYDQVLKNAMDGIDNINIDLNYKIKKRSWEIPADKLAADSLYNEYAALLKKNELFRDSIKNIHAINAKKAKIKFKPKFDHYYIEHSFRAKNQFNAYRLSTYFFLLNKNLNVISAGDVAERDAERQNLMNEIQSLEKKYGQ